MKKNIAPRSFSWQFFTASLCAVGILWGYSTHCLCDENQLLSRFIPSESTGFSLVKKPDYYARDTLWYYINGGAIPYLDYGFREVVTFTGQVKQNTLKIVVNIYDMADSLGAFGIFSSERSPDNAIAKIGITGFHTENQLCFWKDRYYIKVFSYKDSPETTFLIEQVARIVDKLIPSGAGMPWYFSLFPTKNKLENTESFVARDVLGQDYLKNAYNVLYRKRDEEFYLYLIDALSHEEASRQFQKFREYLCKYGELEESHVIIKDEVLSGKEDWYGPVLLVRNGAFIIGVLGLSDFNQAVTDINILISGLTQ